jgi:dienelactone hydrolase
MQYSSAGEPGAATAWQHVWRSTADHVRELGERDAVAGNARTAGKKLLRASMYYFMAERMMRTAAPERPEIYQSGLATFKRGVTLMGERVEFVEVPYGSSALPALFVHPRTPALDGAPGPCMVYLDGFDVNKELLYYGNAVAELSERGISVLILDHPGVGESLRLRHLPAIPEMERAGTAAYDYLGSRADVDADRVGIMGISLGGYYAPRAAAFEKRFACCVAWGGSTRFSERIERALRQDSEAGAVTDMLEHGRWVFGAADNVQLLEITKRITLRGIAEKITCPLLIVHGQNDRQVPVAHALEVYQEAVNSPDRELKVFTSEDGGSEHVNFDNPGLAVDYLADWLQVRLSKSYHPPKVIAS